MAAAEIRGEVRECKGKTDLNEAAFLFFDWLIAISVQGHLPYVVILMGQAERQPTPDRVRLQGLIKRHALSTQTWLKSASC